MATDRSSPSAASAGIVDRNIEVLLQRRRALERKLGFQARMAEGMTRFAGSMSCVYLHLAIVAAWLAINLGWTPLPRFDPTFVILAMAASVEAIFLSTFVLITQNRMKAEADRRADLDLQISLLAEHEITRLIHLVSAIADRLGLPSANDPELAELKKDVMPEQVMDKIEQKEHIP